MYVIFTIYPSLHVKSGAQRATPNPTRIELRILCATRFVLENDRVVVTIHVTRYSTRYSDIISQPYSESKNPTGWALVKRQKNEIIRPLMRVPI